MTIRTVAYVGTVALLSQLLLVQGCGSNNPSTANTGGTTSAGGATAAATGGTTSAGGATAITPTGGTPSAGGATVTSSGGTTSAAGTTATSSGGSTGTAGTTGTFEPLCANLITAAGSSPTKNGVCTSADPPLCYKTCGPKSIGFKSETCPPAGGVYAEESGCEFPTGVDYSCYKVAKPFVLDPTCPTTTPQANTSCNVADCVLCNDPTTGGYLDSTGSAKTGYCVCPATSSGSPGKWSCASSTAWPCPAGQGC